MYVFMNAIRFSPLTIFPLLPDIKQETHDTQQMQSPTRH